MKSTSNFLRQLGFTRPGILVNEMQARINIRNMLAKANRAGAVFRPHFKTHQSAQVGRWFADEGVSKITVSSVEMAEYFAGHGWIDITIAFLLNPLEWPRIESLAGKLFQQGGQLGLTIDSVVAAASVAGRPNVPLNVWIKVDAGYGRTGVSWDDLSTLKAIVENLDPAHRIQGLLAHSGDSYNAPSLSEVSNIWHQTRQRLVQMAQQLDIPDLLISVGDTPSCRSVDDLSGVHEIRPGNFVFFDLMQFSQGVCEAHELAAAAVCPVVGLYPQRRQIAVHGGAVHLSREFLKNSGGKSNFGCLGAISCKKDGSISQQVFTHLQVVSLSQEHGIIENLDIEQAGFDNLEIGDLVLLWPVHSCLTCDLSSEYKTTSGDVLNKF